ncbi:MAG: RNA-binding S4 domain-containing protein [Tissierellia bacterium]|nr:RNA-binding S4 domain-containing protein [Tissierellia bacterium]
MRIDKYLKVSRLIKRRTVAKEACEQGRVFLNGREAKSGSEVKIGDIISLKLGEGELRVEVLSLEENVKKEDAINIYKKL